MKTTTKTRLKAIEKFIENYNEYFQIGEDDDNYLTTYPSDYDDNEIILYMGDSARKTIDIDKFYKITVYVDFEGFLNWLSDCDWELI